MSDPTDAQQPHEPPPLSDDPHEILRQASGGRLLLRMLLVVVALDGAQPTMRLAGHLATVNDVGADHMFGARSWWL